jgi:hypothetical protein
MHRNAIRSAGLSKNPSKSSNGFRPAYNLFRRKRGRHLLCAVPEDYPVPGFIDGQGWAFAGKVGELSTAPLGFERKAAEAVAPLTGFYLFSAFEVGPDKRLGRPVRCAA